MSAGRKAVEVQLVFDDGTVGRVAGDMAERLYIASLAGVDTVQGWTESKPERRVTEVTGWLYTGGFEHFVAIVPRPPTGSGLLNLGDVVPDSVLSPDDEARGYETGPHYRLRITVEAIPVEEGKDAEGN